MTLSDLLTLASSNASPQARADLLALARQLPVPAPQRPLCASPHEIEVRAAISRNTCALAKIAAALEPIAPHYTGSPALDALHDMLMAVRQHVAIVAAIGGEDAQAMGKVQDCLDDAMCAVLEAQQ